MRIGIVGAGITGLAVATHLVSCGDHEVTVFESDEVFGGRANTREGGEHCARLFLSDYDHLLALLDQVPAGDGLSVARSLRPLRRLCRTEAQGWVEISHLNPLLSSDFSLQDKAALLREWRRRPILAEEKAARQRQAWRFARNLSVVGWLQVVHSFLRRPRTYGFDVPTEDALIVPWVRHLEKAGVVLRTSAPVQRIEPSDGGVRLVVDETAFGVDAAVVTAFLPDASELLAASGIGHRLPQGENIHCPCLTIDLDRREVVLEATRPVLVSGHGVFVIVQPESARAIALSADFGHPTADALLHRVRNVLDLEHPERAVAVRDNLRPSEGLFCSDDVDASRAFTDAGPTPNLYLAGSYTKTSYPVDSGEGAALSAHEVVRRMARHHGARLGEPPAPPRRGFAPSLLNELAAEG